MSEEPTVRVRDFVQAKISRVSVADDQDIFALGFVNSLFAMELIMFVEREFDLRIPNDELRLDNFRTINSMVGLVRRVGALQQKVGGT